MTIAHPRVGIDIIEITPTGTDENSAALVSLQVGETLIIPAAVSGGIKLSAAGIGDRVSVRFPNSATIRLYLPAGDSVYGTAGAVTNFEVNDLVSFNGQVFTLTKVSSTEWINPHA